LAGIRYPKKEENEQPKFNIADVQTCATGFPERFLRFELSQYLHKRSASAILIFMPELPWRKFFPQDWKADPQLSRCSPATRGIWIDAICVMMQLDTYKIEGTDEELARDFRADLGQIQAAHEELKRTGAAKVCMQNGCKIWICKRLERKHGISQSRRNAALAMHSKHHANIDAKWLQDVDANTHAPSASVSASASVSTSNQKINMDVFNRIESRLFVLFKRKQNGMPYSEQADISRLTARPDILEELSGIERWMPMTRKPPQSLYSLVTGWEKFVDQSRNFKPERTPEEEKRIRNLANQL
jgi:hypothetical protein